MAVLRYVVEVRCFACVPTPRCVVAVAALPCASTAAASPAGAERTSVLAAFATERSPWQAVQPEVVIWFRPSTCVASALPVTPVVAYPAPWQLAQFAFSGWAMVLEVAGGEPWQRVQVVGAALKAMVAFVP